MSKQEQNLHAENDASQLISFLCNHIVDGAKHLQNSMWTGRSLTFVKAFVPVMVALRDAQATDLLPTSFLEYLQLEKLANIAFNHQGQYGENFEAVCKPLIKYIETLPGYNAENPSELSQKIIDQHGFIAMIVTRTIGEIVVFGTSTLKTDFVGMDLTALFVSHRDSLVKQANLDHDLFLSAANDEDKLFTKQGAVENEHDLFRYNEEDNIFAQSEDPEDNITAVVLDFFSKKAESESSEENHDMQLSKAS